MGKFKGKKTFRWMVEHCLGYSAWLCVQIAQEAPSTSSLSKNKFAFKEYLESLPEGIEAIAQKANEKAAKASSTTTASTSTCKRSALGSMVLSSRLSPSVLAARIAKRTVSPRKICTSPGKNLFYVFILFCLFIIIIVITIIINLIWDTN